MHDEILWATLKWFFFKSDVLTWKSSQLTQKKQKNNLYSAHQNILFVETKEYTKFNQIIFFVIWGRKYDEMDHHLIWIEKWKKIVNYDSVDKIS